MMMVRERALMVRKAAIGMRFALIGSSKLNRCGLSLVFQMKRGEQLKTDIPNEYEQQHQGALPPQKR